MFYNLFMEKEVKEIVNDILKQCNVEFQLKEKLNNLSFDTGRLLVISIGKAAWQLALITSKYLTKKIDKGIILTKYSHSQERFADFEIYEAAHPITDENCLRATERIIELVRDTKENDDIIFLISGGGSALLELPLIPLEQLQTINEKLLHNAVNIYDINLIRKKLSQVKGGKLAKMCKSHIHNFILSDVIGNDLSIVASGPTVQSKDDTERALKLNELYNLNIDINLLKQPLPKIDNISSYVIGSNTLLAKIAEEKLTQLSYDSNIVTTTFTNDVNLLKEKILAFTKEKYSTNKAFIFSGEPILTVTGNGKGGRCQHLIAISLKEMAKTKNSTLIAFGSDGTDGPTDAAGAYCTSKMAQSALKINIDSYINNFDSYNLLKQLDGLIFTGPTGTNINDLYILLIEADQ